MAGDIPDLDAYAVLGVGPEADPAEIRAAFRRRVQERHPDTAPPQATPSPVHEVVEAYRILMDPASRARYDAERARRGPAPGGERIPVRRGPRPGSERAAPEGPCAACSGAGRVTVVTDCSACAGTGEVTLLDTSRARRMSCRACGGGGRRTILRTCPRCAGSGLGG